jgi:XRE family aerobic/anaerobic benzoate catabolism transcriptional regulator
MSANGDKAAGDEANGDSESETAYLRLLGERIREARARRGMTRKILARDSQVSERYLAQLETGQGNISIILLRQVAQAMGLPLADLVREGPDRSVELALLLQTLERLSPAEIGQARQLLAGAFGAAMAEGRRHRIALVGLRGAGKSTLGRRLAETRGIPFIELDREIERESGLALGEIFALYGQPAFRRFERRCLEAAIEHNESCVIATGGSLVSEPGTFDLLLACFTIWIKAAPAEHMGRVLAQGDTRPMAENEEAMEDLRRILAGREVLYSKADAVIDTAGKTIDSSFAALSAAVE